MHTMVVVEPHKTIFKVYYEFTFIAFTACNGIIFIFYSTYGLDQLSANATSETYKMLYKID